MMFDCGLQNIFQLKSGQSRSINWENRNGEKGKGGMASSDLGPSRKGSPCIPKIEAGETVTLGEIQGEGIIQHIWITVTDRTSERNRYVLRDLVLRMYWYFMKNSHPWNVPLWRFLLLRFRCFLSGNFRPDCCQSDPWFQQLFPDAVP